MICAELGLIGKETVAIDGSKFRASNSRLKYHSEKKIEEKIQHFTDKVEHYVNLLDTYGKDDSDKPELSSSEATFSSNEIIKRIEIIGKIAKFNNRLEELHLLKEQVKQNGTIYETDPDARMMKVSGSAIDICHNVQIAVDSKNHMIVAVDVTSQAIDKEQLYNVASQAKENLEVDTLKALADKGYYSALQFALCESNGISPIVSKATRLFIAATKGHAKEAFIYGKDKSGYFCLQGHFLKAYSMDATSKSAGFIAYENRQVCRSCNVRHLCTKGKYRKVVDKPFEEHARSVDKRTSENEGAYKMRQQLAEHPWGAIKRS